MIAHTLGNPFDLAAVTSICARKYDLWLVEDCCDAVGATYNGQKNVGTFGDLATTSFYPAHHITMGEGGAVLMEKPAAENAWSNPSAIGAATAGAIPARTIPAASVLNGIG